MAVGDARPVPVPPSAPLAHQQGLRAPVGQRKAGFTSSLYATDCHIGHKGLRIELPCNQRQDGTSVSDCLQELLATGYSLLKECAQCFLLSQKYSHLQKRFHMVSSARDRQLPSVAFSVAAAVVLHLLGQTPASSARESDGFKSSPGNDDRTLRLYSWSSVRQAKVLETKASRIHL